MGERGEREGEPEAPETQSAAGSLTRQAGIVIIARAIAFVLSFAVPIILTRVITQEQYGHYRQVIFLLGFFYPILQFGITQSLYYFYPRESERRPGLLTQTVVFLAATSLSFAVLFTAARELVGIYFNDPVMTDFAPIVAPFVALMVIASIIDVLPIVQQKMRLTFWVIICSETLRAALLVATAVTTRDVRAMVIALVVFSTLRACVLLGILRVQHLLGARYLKQSFFREQLKYSIPFGLAGTVVTFIQMTDRLYLSRYVDASQFAVYSVGCFQLPVIMIVFQSSASVMLGRMAALQRGGHTAEMIALLRSAVRKLSLVALPAVAVSLVLSYEIITVVYTTDYAAAVPVFMVFLALIPRAASAYSTVPRAFGLTPWIFRLTLVALVVAVVLVIVLTPRLGLLGPAIAVVTALWVVAGGQVWKSGQLLGTGIRGLYPWGELLRIGALAAVLAVGLALARSATELSSLVELAVGGTLYCVSYLLLAIRLGLIRRAEVVAAWSELRGRLGIGAE